MSAVHPLFIVGDTRPTRDESVIIGHEETSMSDEHSSRFSEEPENDSDDDNTRFPGEIYSERDALLKSLSPLIRILRVTGLYFRQKDVESATMNVQMRGLSVSGGPRRNNPGSRNLSENGGRKKKLWYRSKVYSVVVLALLWIYLARFMLVFRSNDRFDSVLINKLTTFAWMLMAAITHTSCVMACWSGRLDSVFYELRVTGDFIERIQRRSTINCIAALIAFAAQVIFINATIFIDSPHFELFYVPFANQIPAAGLGFYGFKMGCLLVLVFVSASWILPQALNHTLAMILVLLYGELDAKFVKAIDENGRFNGNIRTFRRRHQAICRAVKAADHFVMIGNVAGFICHIFTVISYLFSLVIFTFNTDKFIALYFVAGLIGNGVGLAVTTYNGIAVNEMVCDHIRSFYLLVWCRGGIYQQSVIVQQLR